MPLPHLSSTVKVALLIEIKLPSGTRLRYQNYNQSGAIVWNIDGRTYQYLPMIYSGAAKSLEFDNTKATIYLPNNELIRSYMIENDGFRKAVITTTRIFPDDPNAVPIAERLQVRVPTFEGAQIVLELQSPISAINANVPRVFFTQARFPELPRNKGVIVG